MGCQSDPARKIHSLKSPILIGLIRDWIKVLAESITKLQANKWRVPSQQVENLSNCNNTTHKLQLGSQQVASLPFYEFRLASQRVSNL